MPIRVNVKTRVQNAAIRKDKRNGRDVIIVPSATLPDNVVMNRILYPAETIAESYQTLERTPAPMGHPMINGAYASARDPEAINANWIGAWNENVRREGGRVKLDKVIDLEVAQRTDQGKSLLKAIDEGDPIHTSTGLLIEKTPVEDQDDYDFVASEMLFDHDAILLDEEGAATPDQGVGMMVNSNGETEQTEAINVTVPEDELEFMADMIMDSVERQERREKRAGLREKLANFIRDVFQSETKADGLTVNANEGEDMPITDEQFKELEKKVDTLATNSEKLTDTVAKAVGEAVKPLNEKLEAIEANSKAEQEAKRKEYADKVVNAGLLDEEDAKEMSINHLQKLADKVKPGQAAPIINGVGGGEPEDPWKGYDLNANIDGDKGGDK